MSASSVSVAGTFHFVDTEHGFLDANIMRVDRWRSHLGTGFNVARVACVQRKQVIVYQTKVACLHQRNSRSVTIGQVFPNKVFICFISLNLQS